MKRIMVYFIVAYTSGEYCELELTPCSSSPCPVGSTCRPYSSSPLGFDCECPPGFSGPDCAERRADAGPHGCDQGGRCLNGGECLRGGACRCKAGFQGEQCQEGEYVCSLKKAYVQGGLFSKAVDTNFILDFGSDEVRFEPATELIRVKREMPEMKEVR